MELINTDRRNIVLYGASANGKTALYHELKKEIKDKNYINCFSLSDMKFHKKMHKTYSCFIGGKEYVDQPFHTYIIEIDNLEDVIEFCEISCPRGYIIDMNSFHFVKNK